MNTKVIAAAAVALGLAGLTAQPAAAGVIDYTYVNGSVTATLDLTVSLSSGDEYNVTAIGGTWDGAAITGIAPVGTCCFPPNNDNLFFPNGDESVVGGFGDLTLGGIAFTTATDTINLFGIGGVGYAYIVNEDGREVTGGTLTAGVPEPASWALMLAGFGGLGAMLRRRKLNLA